MVERLDEQAVSDAFHSYLKSSLAQATAERLLDPALLAQSTDPADVMLAGPSLCLYFAALRCTTNPPSVPLPRPTKSRNQPPIDLSVENCPEAFINFLTLWSRTVQPIQSLPPNAQHDLARIICGLEPVSSPLDSRVGRLAHELRAVAIEIGQRRTFQERFEEDLQEAIDRGGGGDGDEGRKLTAKASFRPPPLYDDSLSVPHQPPPQPPISSQTPSQTQSQTHTRPISRPISQTTSQTFSQSSERPPVAPLAPSLRASTSSNSSSIPRTPITPTSPSLAASSPSIVLIRETLYASLADVLSRSSYLRGLLKRGRDPARTYFSAVGMAILEVGIERTGGDPQYIMHPNNSNRPSLDGNSPSEPHVRGIMDTPLAFSAAPPPLQPFLLELVRIGVEAREMREEDSLRAVKALSEGLDTRSMPRPRLDRVRRMLERGVAAEDEDSSEDDAGYFSSSSRTTHTSTTSRSSTGRRLAKANSGSANGHTRTQRPQSPTSRALQLTNRVNALALSMTKLRAFRERQAEVFRVLAGVSGGG